MIHTWMRVKREEYRVMRISPYDMWQWRCFFFFLHGGLCWTLYIEHPSVDSYMENLASAYRKLKREQISSIARPATMKRKNKGVWIVQCTKLIYKGVVRLPSVFHGSSRASSSLFLLYVHNALFLNSMASVVSLSLSLSLAHHAFCVFFFFLFCLLIST